MGITDLKSEWQKAGIDKGDTVLIHSNIARTIRRFSKDRSNRPGIELFVKSFLDAVGASGTILFPVFNFGFSEGEPFDIKNTPSKMGKLTETARLHPDAVRTGHPIYSFAVIGAKSDQFENINNKSGYGEDSPFAILRQLNGKIASLDLEDQNSMTFYHHVEEMNDVSYRYMKTFEEPYTSWDGTTEIKEYSLFVRNTDMGVKTHVNPAGELLWQDGLYSGFRPKQNCGLRVINANQMFDFVSNIIKSNKAKGLLYRIEDNLVD